MAPNGLTNTSKHRLFSNLQDIYVILRENDLLILTFCIGFITQFFLELVFFVLNQFGDVNIVFRAVSFFASAALGWLGARRIDQIRLSKNELREEMSEIHYDLKKVDQKIENQLIEYIYEIDNKKFGNGIDDILQDLLNNASNNDPTTLNKTLHFFQSWNTKIVPEPKMDKEVWRLIVDYLLIDLRSGEFNNYYTLSLNTYLNLLYSVLKFGIWQDGNFVMHSYTNATPLNWYSSDNDTEIDNWMENYRKNMEVLLSKNNSGNVLNRYVLCYPKEEYNDSEAELKREYQVFKSEYQVLAEWKHMRAQQRQDYLDNFHIDNRAYYVVLNPEVVLQNEYSELIYMGYRGKNSDIIWKWCFCCRYTPKAKSLSVSFKNLSENIHSDSIAEINCQNEFVDKTNSKLTSKRKISFSEFPSFINEDNFITDDINFRKIKFLSKNINDMNINLKLINSLAGKWHIASELWHNDEEIDIIEELFRQEGIGHDNKILDSACGTGFHAIELKKLGYRNIWACDYDPENVYIFKQKQKESSIAIPVKTSDWKTINKDYNDKFDTILCLGSSITYFESWDENKDIDKQNRENGLLNIFKNYKAILDPYGKLIIGYSRHYDTQKEESVITFPEKKFKGKSLYLKWILNYSWEKKEKTWTCMILNSKNEQINSFTLKSHVYSLEEFEKLCKKCFSNVEMVDVNEGYYDRFFVCKP